MPDSQREAQPKLGGGDRDSLFLPDFCAIGTVFMVVLVGELLAFVLVLARPGGWAGRWESLGEVSLFVQWVALTSAAALCLSRRWLGRLGNPVAGIATYALVLVATWALSEAAFWLVAERHVSLDIATARREDFLIRNLAVSAIVAAVVLRYFYIHHQWRTRIESEAQARIQALQSRIRPHFLFNSMNTIASLTRTRPDLAEQAVEDLAALFRASLGDAQVPVRVGQELALCRQYVRIETQRMGERLGVHWAVDALPEDALLPALTLQPLVENAIYHGVEPMTEGGVVRIEGQRDGNDLSVFIVNQLDSQHASVHRHGNQMAQANVRERLSAFFGVSGGLTVEKRPGEYHVRIHFPYVTARPEVV